MSEHDYVWCLHCERARKASSWPDMDECPADDCDGFGLGDRWPWSKIRIANPDYPRKPAEGAYYALYGNPSD